MPIFLLPTLYDVGDIDLCVKGFNLLLMVGDIDIEPNEQRDTCCENKTLRERVAKYCSLRAATMQRLFRLRADLFSTSNATLLWERARHDSGHAGGPAGGMLCSRCALGLLPLRCFLRSLCFPCFRRSACAGLTVGAKHYMCRWRATTPPLCHGMLAQVAFGCARTILRPVTRVRSE